MSSPPPRILVVEDETVVRMTLTKLLERDGYDVVAVESGKEALEQIASRRFDLALIDLKLPDMDGLAVLSALRQRAPDTAAIILTAYASLETAVEALRQGAHDYLFKPCRTVELRESIRTALIKRQRELRQRQLLEQLKQIVESYSHTLPLREFSPPAKSSPETATSAIGEQDRFRKWGGLIVDCMRHMVTLDGQLLELSPTEFNLLAYLVSEAPRVVSVAELAREVCGYECETWEARDIIRQHIYNIRRKARALTGRADIIRTVRGVGYTVGPQEPI